VFSFDLTNGVPEYVRGVLETESQLSVNKYSPELPKDF
jgi:hypothetical protein